MVSVCLCSDAFLQHLPSYLGFSYPGRGVSLHGCSSKAQLLLLTLDERCLLTDAPPDLERGVDPLGPPAPMRSPLFGHGVAPLGRCPWPRAWGSSSWPPPLASKFSKPGFSNTWTVNFQMFKLVLEKAEEPEIKLSTSAGSLKKQGSSRKNLLLLYWLCQSLWLWGSQ